MQAHVEEHQTDVLVIGGGLAGAMAAVYAKQTCPDLDVTLLDKATVGLSGQSVFAAGVCSVFIPGEDDFDVWMREIVLNSEFLSDQAWACQFLQRGHAVWESLCRTGEALGKTVLEREPSGRFIRRRSRGHNKTSHCVLHSIEAMATLREWCAHLGVAVANRAMAVALLGVDGRIGGAVAFNVREGTVHVLRARTTVLACSGSAFKTYFVGYRNLTGEMQMEAFRHGAELVGLDQTNGNTCSKHHDIHGLNLFVGSGGRFINGLGAQFMWKYDPNLGSRARQPELTIGFSREVAEGRGPIYLDMSSVTPADQELMRRVLPETFRTWDAAGINPFQAPIEWVPVWQGTVAGGGGIRINTRCETNLAGLYAAGDTTNVPIHGTYSFGGVNIGFAAVSGAIAGENAARAAADLGWLSAAGVREQVTDAVARIFAPFGRSKGCRPMEVFNAVQQIMVADVGYVKSEAKLRRALSGLDAVREMAAQVGASDYHELAVALECQHQADLAEAILGAALCRQESRGFHFRTEFPYSDNQHWLKWVVCRMDRGRPAFVAEDVPQPYYQPVAARHRPPGMRLEEAADLGLGEPELQPAPAGPQR